MNRIKNIMAAETGKFADEVRACLSMPRSALSKTSPLVAVEEEIIEIKPLMIDCKLERLIAYELASTESTTAQHRPSRSHGNSPSPLSGFVCHRDLQILNKYIKAVISNEAKEIVCERYKVAASRIIRPVQASPLRFHVKAEKPNIPKQPETRVAFVKVLQKETIPVKDHSSRCKISVTLESIIEEEELEWNSEIPYSDLDARNISRLK